MPLEAIKYPYCHKVKQIKRQATARFGTAMLAGSDF